MKRGARRLSAFASQAQSKIQQCQSPCDCGTRADRRHAGPSTRNRMFSSADYRSSVTMLAGCAVASLFAQTEAPTPLADS